MITIISNLLFPFFLPKFRHDFIALEALLGIFYWFQNISTRELQNSAWIDFGIGKASLDRAFPICAFFVFFVPCLASCRRQVVVCENDIFVFLGRWSTPRELPNECFKAKDLKRKYPSEISQRKFPSEGSQTKVSKRTIPIEISQANDPKRQIPN